MGAGCCALAFASPPSRGSTVLVPPLIADGAVKHKRIAGTLRLPSQAGKVSKMVRTNLVSKGPSWIAKGDKYYSLCTPNRRMVACAPIVATSVMQDIEVDARKVPNREPLLTFTVATGTRQAPKRLTHAIAYFLARTNKQVAHFNRMAVAYSPSSGSVSSRSGLTKSAIVAGNGGGCSYDDDDSYDCSGGDSGLLGLIPPRQLQHARMGAPATRPAHLRASIVTDPNRLLLQRCTCQAFADATVATLSLARLSLTGPGPAGQALLRALAALHPDALTPFPALLAE